MSHVQYQLFIYVYLRKCQVIVYICEWIYKESVTFFKYCKVTPFRRCNWSKMRDQVDAAKDCINWNDGGSAVSSLHRPRHLIHEVFPIWCGWDRAEPFNISKMVWASDVGGWEQIVNAFAGYLEYNADLGNTDT